MSRNVVGVLEDLKDKLDEIQSCQTDLERFTWEDGESIDEENFGEFQAEVDNLIDKIQAYNEAARELRSCDVSVISHETKPLFPLDEQELSDVFEDDMPPEPYISYEDIFIDSVYTRQDWYQYLERFREGEKKYYIAYSMLDLIKRVLSWTRLGKQMEKVPERYPEVGDETAYYEQSKAYLAACPLLRKALPPDVITFMDKPFEENMRNLFHDTIESRYSYQVALASFRKEKTYGWAYELLHETTPLVQMSTSLKLEYLHKNNIWSQKDYYEHCKAYLDSCPQILQKLLPQDVIDFMNKPFEETLTEEVIKQLFHEKVEASSFYQVAYQHLCLKKTYHWVHMMLQETCRIFPSLYPKLDYYNSLQNEWSPKDYYEHCKAYLDSCPQILHELLPQDVIEFMDKPFEEL